jgi:hypothetical protein
MRMAVTITDNTTRGRVFLRHTTTKAMVNQIAELSVMMVTVHDKRQSG